MVVVVVSCWKSLVGTSLVPSPPQCCAKFTKLALHPLLPPLAARLPGSCGQKTVSGERPPPALPPQVNKVVFLPSFSAPLSPFLPPLSIPSPFPLCFYNSLLHPLLSLSLSLFFTLSLLPPFIFPSSLTSSFSPQEATNSVCRETASWRTPARNIRQRYLAVTVASSFSLSLSLSLSFCRFSQPSSFDCLQYPKMEGEDPVYLFMNEANLFLGGEVPPTTIYCTCSP